MKTYTVKMSYKQFKNQAYISIEGKGFATCVALPKSLIRRLSKMPTKAIE